MAEITNGSASPVVCGNLEVSADRISLFQDNKELVKIPIGEIVDITVKRGLLAERFILQLIFGIALCTLGYFPLRYFIDWLRFGGEIWDWQILLILTLLFGIWILHDALKRGYFLEVACRDDKRKLAFGPEIEQPQLHQFVADSTELLGRVVNNRI